MLCLYPFDSNIESLKSDSNHLIICDDLTKLALNSYEFCSNQSYNGFISYKKNRYNYHYMIDLYPLFDVDNSCPCTLVLTAKKSFLSDNLELYNMLTCFATSIFNMIAFSDRESYIIQEFDFVQNLYKYYLLNNNKQLSHVPKTYLSSELIKKLQYRLDIDADYLHNHYLTINNSTAYVIPFLKNIDPKILEEYSDCITINDISIQTITQEVNTYSSIVSGYDRIKKLKDTIEARSAYKKMFLD